MGNIAYLLVNFGGPRDLAEVEEFLIALLTDQEVIRTSWPAFFHRLVFTAIAKRRSKKIVSDYALIGGKSPIFEDTEIIANKLSQILGSKVLTFHRYLPETHPSFIEQAEALCEVSEIRVFPMFPQYSTATTGSIALWFSAHLPLKIINKMAWVKSFPDHLSYISAMERCLREFLKEKGLKEEECVLLFSAHGLPQKFIDTGDIYEKECRLSFDQIKARFPKAIHLLSYQSKFGRAKWISPYTNDLVKEIAQRSDGRKVAVVIPLSFTSDHIETLYEIEELYLPVIRDQGMLAYRCPALNQSQEWIEAIAQMFCESSSHQKIQAVLRSGLST